MTRTTEFERAASIYNENGVDVDRALKKLAAAALSIHAWQGDDVRGFEGTGHPLTGGCGVTGNYPGRARNSDELRSDLDFALSLIPGRHRVCLQAHEVDGIRPGTDRDAFSIDNFRGWLEWSSERRIPIDIAPVFYSHPKLDHGLSLSHPDRAIRKFWIDHGRAVRRIAAAFGRNQGSSCVCNFWVPDGFKDTPADRLAPRLRLAEALDECFAEKFPESELLDAVEPKLFGIGAESYTVGSHDFYLIYATTRKKLICLDTGHFHPTESVADKLSAIEALQGAFLLHVSRGVRWDSDHVVTLNDELLGIGREIIACNLLNKCFIGLDYFDAGINRTAAWIIGARNMLKSLLIGLLEPPALAEYEKKWDFTARLAVQESLKSLPWGTVWRHYCEISNMPDDCGIMTAIRQYERKTLSKRTGEKSR